jgi:hypothetical protein
MGSVFGVYAKSSAIELGKLYEMPTAKLCEPDTLFHSADQFDRLLEAMRGFSSTPAPSSLQHQT